jgi:hypothetical protein
MNKPYKVSYKTYHNDRLKPVPFHGKDTYPLYVQVTFNRKTIFFKSYYFELYSSPRYSQVSAGKKQAPAISDIVRMEEDLIAFIVDKYPNHFSLEVFKSEYDFFCRDLCDVFQEGFRVYMFIFFHERQMTAMGRALAEGAKFSVLNEMIQNMKTLFKPAIYAELVEQSIANGQPYIPVYEYALQRSRSSIVSLTIRDWQRPEQVEQFEKFLHKKYSEKEARLVLKQVREMIRMIRESEKG